MRRILAMCERALREGAAVSRWVSTSVGVRNNDSAMMDGLVMHAQVRTEILRRAELLAQSRKQLNKNIKTT